MNDLSPLISSFLAAFWVHDAEELITMSASTRRHFAKLPRWIPISDKRRRRGFSSAHAVTGITTMGILMSVATLAGFRSNGRSVAFRGALLGFGLHGYGHLAMSALARGYTSGTLTSSVVVLPYWWWARREMKEAGIVVVEPKTLAVALSGLGVAGAVHTLTAALLREWSYGPADR